MINIGGKIGSVL